MRASRSARIEGRLNGVLLGTVKPDLKKQRVKLPNRFLKTVIPNEVIFDHVANPPGLEPWAISKARLIVEHGP